MRILGIETSCDDTAAAVVESGRHIVSAAVSSQLAVHHPYGGVVPELASRAHIEAIEPVVENALQTAQIGFNEIEAIAATQGPGLVGSLLVGFSYAKALAYALRIPWVGVDHLAAHINSVFLLDSPPPFPFVALLVSGGHTALYYVRSHAEFERMGQTRDDAVGEAFDKVSKMMGLGYPGGTVIEQLSRKGDPDKITFPRAYLEKGGYDFSFSGVKTAVKRYVETHGGTLERDAPHIAAGFQEAVVRVLADKLLWACEATDCRHLAVVGGVAANARLRQIVSAAAQGEQIQVHLPPPALCGDNAAMVAAAGYHSLCAGKRGDLSDDVYSRSH